MNSSTFKTTVEKTTDDRVQLRNLDDDFVGDKKHESSNNEQNNACPDPGSDLPITRKAVEILYMQEKFGSLPTIDKQYDILTNTVIQAISDQIADNPNSNELCDRNTFLKNITKRTKELLKNDNMKIASPSKPNHHCSQCKKELPLVQYGLNWVKLSEFRTEDWQEFGTGATYFCNYLCLCKWIQIHCHNNVKVAREEIEKEKELNGKKT